MSCEPVLLAVSHASASVNSSAFDQTSGGIILTQGCIVVSSPLQAAKGFASDRPTFLKWANVTQPPNCISIAHTAAKTSHAFLWGGQPPKIASSSCGIWTPSNTWFFWPTRISPQMASRSVQPFLHTPQQRLSMLFYGADNPQNCLFFLVGSGPNLIHGSFGPP